MINKSLAAAIVLLLISSSALADGWPGREIPLPFPSDASPTGHQFAPDSACAGDECLVAWMAMNDDPPVNTWNIRAARVTKSGKVLDSTSFIIANGGMNTSRPQVIARDSGYVVFYGGALYAKVSRDGRVLDRDLRLSFSNDRVSIVQAVHGPAGVLVFWVANQGPLIPALTLVDENLKDIRDVKVDGYPQDIVATATGFAVASLAVGGTNVTRLASDGSAISTTVVADQLSSSVLAASGDSLLVGSRRNPTSTAPGAILIAAITSDGIQHPLVLDTFVGGVATSLSVTSNGSGYLVAWSRPSAGYYSDNVYAQRIGTAGEVIDPKPIVVSPNAFYQINANAAAVGGSYLLCWADTRFGLGHDHVFGAIVPQSGTIGGDFLVSRSTPSQLNAVLAVADDVIGVAWNQSGLSPAQGAVMFTRLLPDGRLLDTAPARLNRYAGDAPAIVSYAGLFIVAWREGGSVQFRIMRSDGSVIAGSGIGAQGSGDVSAAAGPDGVALVWTQNDLIMYSRIGYDGTRLDVMGHVIGQGSRARVGFDGANYWLVNRDRKSSAIEARRLSRDGVPIDTIPFTVPGSGGDLDQLALGCGDRTCVALWRSVHIDGPAIDGALLTSGGVVPAIVTARAEAIAQPALTWNGESYLLTWTAREAGETVSNIHATHLSPSGNLLGPETNVTASENDERSPAVTMAGKQPVFAFSRGAKDAGDHLFLRLEGEGTRRRSARH